MHVHQDSVYQNIKGWKGAPVEDSLIKWRKKCCGAVFSVLTLLFCVHAGGCARALLAVARSLSPCLPSVERRYMLPSSVCPISFVSHWSSCNIRESPRSPETLGNLSLGWSESGSSTACLSGEPFVSNEFLPWHHISKNDERNAWIF